MKGHKLDPEEITNAGACLRHARQAAKRQELALAEQYVRRALALSDTEPAAYNLLGVIYEMRGNRLEAQNSYREALNLDERYEPARYNLRRSVSPETEGSFMLQALKGPDTGDGKNTHS